VERGARVKETKEDQLLRGGTNKFGGGGGEEENQVEKSD